MSKDVDVSLKEMKKNRMQLMEEKKKSSETIINQVRGLYMKSRFPCGFSCFWCLPMPSHSLSLSFSKNGLPCETVTLTCNTWRAGYSRPLVDTLNFNMWTLNMFSFWNSPERKWGRKKKKFIHLRINILRNHFFFRLGFFLVVDQPPSWMGHRRSLGSVPLVFIIHAKWALFLTWQSHEFLLGWGL